MGSRFEEVEPRRVQPAQPRKIIQSSRQQNRLYGTEQDLFAGANREVEKRFEGKLNRIIAENRALGMQIQGTQAFMKELGDTIRQ